MHYFLGLVLVGGMLAMIAVGISGAAAFVTDDAFHASFEEFTEGAIRFKSFQKIFGKE